MQPVDRSRGWATGLGPAPALIQSLPACPSNEGVKRVSAFISVFTALDWNSKRPHRRSGPL